MAKAILICGKICSGKSTYVERLSGERGAVVLSSDELMLAVFDPLLGDKHDEIAAKVNGYLYALSVRLISAGTDVILDWGFWTGEGRAQAEGFFREKGVECEWHYVSVSDATWRRNIERRNAAVKAGLRGAYFVDEGLLRKLESRFEEPARDEMDIWYVNEDHTIQNMHPAG